MLLRAQLADSKENDEKLLEMNNSNSEGLKEQMAKQAADNIAVKASFDDAKRDTEELRNQLQIVDDFNEDDLLATDNSIGAEKNRNTSVWSKQREIMKWLNNSDLKQLKDSDEIIHAMCNVRAIGFHFFFLFECVWKSPYTFSFFFLNRTQNTKSF